MKKSLHCVANTFSDEILVFHCDNYQVERHIVNLNKTYGPASHFEMANPTSFYDWAIGVCLAGSSLIIIGSIVLDFIGK